MESATILGEREYLALEEVSDVRHEYLNGHVVAMAGASLRHNVIVGNLVGILQYGLRDSDCVVMSNDQRVHISATGGYTYPDVVVACGSPDVSAETPPSLKNPRVLIEVLSASTWMRDMAYKLTHYRSIESVTHVLFVGSEERQVVRYRRAEDSWVLTDHVGEDVVELAGLEVSLPLARIYAKTETLPA